MTTLEFIELMREGIYVLVIISAPTMLVSMLVGLIISLFQALTQIQEMTLSFVPKILALFLTLMVAMPFMLETLMDYTNKLADRIAKIE